MDGDGDDRPLVDVVLYQEPTPLHFKVTAYDGKSRAHATDVLLHRSGGRGDARLLGQALLLDARPLVREADGVAMIENRDNRLDEAGMDEVLDQFKDDRIGDVPACVFGEAIGGGSRIGDVGLGFVGFDVDDARRGEHVIVDCDARPSIYVCVIR